MNDLYSSPSLVPVLQILQWILFQQTREIRPNTCLKLKIRLHITSCREPKRSGVILSANLVLFKRRGETLCAKASVYIFLMPVFSSPACPFVALKKCRQLPSLYTEGQEGKEAT